MVSRSGTLGLIVLLAWITSSAGGVYAAALPFDDGFENIAVGYYPVENGWQVWFSGVSGYVSDQVPHSGTRSFRLHSLPYWSRCDYVTLEGVPDRLTYQASLYMDPIPGRAAWVGLAHGVAGNMPCFNHFVVYNEDGSVGSVDFSGAVGLPPVTLGAFAMGEWVTVQADLDFATQTADLWLNGDLAASGAAIQPREFDDPTWGHVFLDCFAAAEFNWVGGGTGVIYLDDVAIVGFAAPAAVEATVDCYPDTIRRGTRARWVTCYIELPAGYSAADIDVATLLLQDALSPAPRPVAVGDYDYDGVADLMVKFDRAALADLLTLGEQEVVLTGALADGTPLAGSGVMRLRPRRGPG